VASSPHKLTAPDRWIAVGLLLLTFFLYSQTAVFDFVNLDDPDFITENPNVKYGLTPESVRWALTTGYINWQPLVYLSHMAVISAFGLDPAAHHVLNAILHALNGALVFVVFRRMRLALWPSAIAAAIFAFHPLRVESVAWVTERKDVLGAFFWLLTMWAYVRYTEAPKERPRYLVVVACFLLGLMAKPILVTLPVALFLLDLWPLKRLGAHSVRELILEKVPLAVLAGIVAVATILTQQTAGAMATLSDMPVATRLANVVRSYALYLWKTVWPADLAVIYPFPDFFPAAEVVAAAIVLVAITFWTWARRRQSPMWLAAWLWYLVVLAPTIGFVQVGPQPYADRYTYLPSLLPLAVLALAVESRFGTRALRIGGAGLAFVLFVVSWLQIGVWRNDFTLYRHAIAVAPGAPLIYVNLGVALEKLGKFNEAIAHYEIAQQLNQNDGGPSLNMGLAYMLSGRAPQAIAPLRRAVQLRPASPTPLYHLSRALLETGQFDESDAQVRKALALSPKSGMAASLHMQLGMAAYLRKDDSAALAAFRDAIKLDPAYWPARKNAGIALGNMGRIPEAIAEFEIYLKANPQDKDVAATVVALRAQK
jgi:tetratricopeptide (TPR) repeat protein